VNKDTLILTIFWIFGGAFILFAYWLRVKHGKTIRERIVGIVEQHGLTDIQLRWWFGNGVRARWQGYAVTCYFHARYKSTPARIVTTVDIDGAPRIIVKRKFGESWLQKPMTLIGPPLVNFDTGQQLWVRADEAPLAERVLRDPRVAALLEVNLIEKFDEIALSAKQLRIQRCIDGTHIKERCGKADQFAITTRVAGEEVPLALAIVQTLALRPRN